jgi:NADPH:quinone reductase-like Zn-dependent oxidoreductase
VRAFEIRQGFGLEALTLTERSTPAVQAGTVLVEMKAASLNYRDLLVTLGKYNPRMALPRVPLSDGVGVVAAVGEGVRSVKVGDRVAGCFFQNWVDGTLSEEGARTTLGGDRDGMLAEQVLLDENGVVPVPAHLSDEEAATLPCAGLTAWSALVSYGGLKAGDTVLVQGTGGVSIFALQFARLMGARVIVTSSSDEKLARAKALGASAFVNYRTHPKWEEQVRELTGGMGVDHVVEVGGAGTLAQSFKAVRRSGRISVIGVLSGAAAEVNPMPVLMRGLTLQGIFVGNRRMFLDMNRALETSALKPVVDRVFPFAEAKEALRYLQSGAHFGKVVIRFF